MGPGLPARDLSRRSAAGAQVLSDGSMILPLDRYDAYAAPGNEQLVFEAATALERRCMRAKGFELPAGYGGKYLPTAPPPMVYYGVAILADARRFGYRAPGLAGTTPPAGPAVSSGVLTAFGGDRTSPGCAEQAYTALRIAEADDAYGALQRLRSEALAAVYADPRLHAADSAWSACMRRAGLDYPDPLAPGRDRTLLGRGLPIPKGATLPPPSPAEKQVATIDVGCKDVTHYLPTFAQLSASHQQLVIAHNTGLLQRALAEWATVLRQARLSLATATK